MSAPPRKSGEMPTGDLATLQAEAEAEGRACVVGGLIVDKAGRLFVQRRAAGRRLFPGAWDIAGGHVEAGETLAEALAREIHEETGWRLRRIVRLVEMFDWAQAEAERGLPPREFDFLVEVEGDLARPTIEAEKFSGYRWVGPGDLAILAENRPPEDRVVLNLARRAIELAGSAAT